MDPELQAALAELNKGVTAMRAEIDALKAAPGRTEPDVLAREKVDRINAGIDKAQGVVDHDRRARTVQEKIQASREARARIEAARAGSTPVAGRVLPALSRRARDTERRSGNSIILPRDWYDRGINQFTGKALSSDELDARSQYLDRFFAWARNSKGHDELGRIGPKAAMQTQIAEKGGFLVPDQLESDVIQLGGLYSAMRQLCDVRTITTGNTLKQPVNVQGATFGWVGELASRTATATDDLAMLQWFLMECYAMPKVTNILLQDAEMDVEGWLNDGITREFAEGEGETWITGTGTNQPRGIQSYTMTADAGWAWGSFGYIASGVAAALTDSTHNGYDALIDVVTALHRDYLANAWWLMNRSTQATIRKIRDENGQYLWQPPVTAGQPAQLLGYPCETDDNMPAIGSNAYPIQFGDHQQAYRIIDKPGMEMIRDDVTEKGKTIFYTTKRTGGAAKNFRAMKFLKIAA